jgi:glycosyltransferase involved in cell wall biosynthesis
VAFDVGGNGEVVADGVTGYIVPPFNTDRMRDRIALLLDNPEQARAFGVAATRRAASLFTIERMVSDVESFYLEALRNAK